MEEIQGILDFAQASLRLQGAVGHPVKNQLRPRKNERIVPYGLFYLQMTKTGKLTGIQNRFELEFIPKGLLSHFTDVEKIVLAKIKSVDHHPFCDSNHEICNCAEDFQGLDKLVMVSDKGNFSFVEHFPNLQRLVIEISEECLELYFPHQLEELAVYGKGIRRIEKKGEDVTNLERLVINDTSLTTIPDWISSMPLNELDLQTNRIKDTAFEHHKIETLDLSHNRLKVIELDTPNLRSLNLSHNPLTSMPNLAGTRLEHLDLMNTNVSGQKPLPKSLKTFFASGFRVDFKKIELTEAAELEILELNSCEIESLPKDLSKLKNLNTLILYDNPLKSISPDMFLPSLTRLEIIRCALEDVPEISPKMFPKLQVLNLLDNNLETVPTSIFEYEMLEIDIDKNPLDLNFKRKFMQMAFEKGFVFPAVPSAQMRH